MKIALALVFVLACKSSSSTTPQPAPSEPPPPAPAEPAEPTSGSAPSRPDPPPEQPLPPEPTPPPLRPDPRPSGPPAASKLGEPCGAGDRCDDGLTCVSYYGIAGARGPQFKTCEVKCDRKGAACPTGTKCVTIADGPGQVCRP